MEKAVEKIKVGFKMKSCIATVSDTQLKQLSTTIKDPTNWEHLEETIAHYMKERIKILHIDYIIIFIKTRRYDNNDQMDEYNDSKMKEIMDIIAGLTRVMINIIPLKTPKPVAG